MSVTITLDQATPLLERVKTLAQAQGIALVAARAVGGLVREHLYGLDNQRHRFGTHFYRQAGDSVTTGLSPQGAVVSVTAIGFAQRRYGGTILPRNAEYLTIPAAPEAYGHRAREFNELDFAFVEDPETGALRPALVRRAQTKIRHRRVKTANGVVFKASPVASLMPEVMYWLVRSVTQQADPSVLPYDEQMQARAVEAMQNRFARLAQRDAGGGGYQS